MSTRLKTGETVLFIGDSITDCDHRGAAKPLGTGYVHLFADLLTNREPAKKVTVLNRGRAGDNIDNLRSRWYEDVLLFKPDWLVVMIGINDLHSWVYEPPKAFLEPAGYEKIYDEVLALTRREMPRCRMALMDPFFMSTDRRKDYYRAQMLGKLRLYIAAVHRLSAKYKTRLVKTHDLFQSRLRHHHPDVYGDEPVHPSQTGHLLIAEAVYNALI